MTSYDQTVARCNAALARQSGIMARLVPNTAAYAIAEDTMAAMQRTKTIFVLRRQRQLAAMTYQLRFQVLTQYRMRGQIIARAAREIKHDVLLVALEARGVDLDETWQCLELYRNWSEFRVAERFQRAEGGIVPDNLNDAIAILNQWKLSRLH